MTLPVLVVSTRDFLWYVDQALDGMVTIVRDLGDDVAKISSRPPRHIYKELSQHLGQMELTRDILVAGKER
jgi:hypothetical protein